LARGISNDWRCFAFSAVLRHSAKRIQDARLVVKQVLKSTLSKLGYEIRKRPVTPQKLHDGVVVGWQRNGRDIRFYLENCFDLIGKDLFNCRFFEEDELEYLRGIVDPQEVMLDVGANIGNHTVYFAAMIGAGKVIAFEPGGWAYPRLAFNVALNGLQDRVTLHKVALSDAPGTAHMRLLAADNHGTLAILSGDEGEGPVETVPVRKGDDYLTDERVGFVKIDAERHEMKVLNGLQKTLSRDKPIVMVEVLQTERAALEAFLADFGYATLMARERYGDIVNVICRTAA